MSTQLDRELQRRGLPPLTPPRQGLPPLPAPTPPPKSPAPPPKSPAPTPLPAPTPRRRATPITRTPVYDEAGELIGIEEPLLQQTLIPTPLDRIRELPKSPAPTPLPAPTPRRRATPITRTPVYDEAGELIGIEEPLLQQTLIPTPLDRIRELPKSPAPTPRREQKRFISEVDMRFKTPEIIPFTERVKGVTKQYGRKEIYQDFGQAFFGAGKYQQPLFLGAFPILFKPLDKLFIPRGHTPTQVKWRGTRIDEGREPFEFRKLTGFERAELISPIIQHKPTEQIIYEESVILREKIERDLKPKFQARIDRGEDFDLVSKEFKKEMNIKFEEEKPKILKADRILMRQRYISPELYKPSIEVSELIGAGTGMITAFKVPPLMTFTGFSVATEGFAEKDYLKMGLGMGVGALGTKATFKKIGSEIDQIRISEAIKSQQPAEMGVRFERGKGFLDVQRFKGDYGFKDHKIKAETLFLGKGQIKGKDSDFMYRGRLITDIKGRRFYDDKPYISTIIQDVVPKTFKRNYIKGMQFGRAIPLEKDKTLGIIEMGRDVRLVSDFIKHKSKLRGKIEYTLPEQPERFDLLVGIGRRYKLPQGEFIGSIGGKVEKAKIDYFLGKGVKGVDKLHLDIPQATPTLLRVVRVKDQTPHKFFNFQKRTTPDLKLQQLKTFPDLSTQILKQTAQMPLPKIFQPTSQKLTNVGVLSLQLKKPTFVDQRQIPQQRQINRLVQKTITPQRQINRLVQKTITPQRLVTPQRQIPQQRQINRLVQKTITPQRQIQKFISPLGISKPRATPIKPRTQLKPFPIVRIPKLPRVIKSQRGLMDLKIRRDYKYFPSFKALIFNIRRREPKPSPMKRWTGLEVRPIIYDEDYPQSLKIKNQKLNFPLFFR